MDGSSRDFGLHGAGKGDAPRTKFDKHWAANYDAIQWGPKLPHDILDAEFKRIGPGRYRKVFKR